MGPKCDPVTNVWSFPKLTKQNYFTWSEQMKATLQAHCLQQYITEDEPKPPKLSVSSPRPTTLSEPTIPLKPSTTGGSNGDKDIFFYSPNYICQKKDQEHYHTWV